MSSKRNESKNEQKTTATMTPTTNEYTQSQQAYSAATHRALDETRDTIKKYADEARSQIPSYVQTVNDYQEQTIQASREIADNYIHCFLSVT